MTRSIAGMQYEVSEWGYSTPFHYDDPFEAVTLDVLFTHENGQIWRVPTFWAGGHEWRVRFAPPLPGTYRFETLCSDTTNAHLHGQIGSLTAAPYTGDHALRVHGALQVAEDQRHLAFEDGTPFFWLGDTWWFHLSKRVRFPEDFALLTQDRLRKGFNVVQLVAGLYPDMAPFDARSANEGGQPWEKDYTRINPAYFDMADLRVQWLVRAGMIPCILGSWGYYLSFMGAAAMKLHWRNLIARWAAYPVVWCLGGELAMPYYLSEKFGTGDDPDLAQAWVEIGEYIRTTDPYQRLLTVHPSSNNPGRDQVKDDRIMDFEMLQPGHDGYPSVTLMLDTLRTQRARTPIMPVLVDEINYEEQVHDSHAAVQRLAFWTAMLSGSAGFTYGASGLWAFNTRDNPWGASPHGLTWSDMPWDESIHLPGAAQIGMGKRLLERYRWHRFEPRPDWVAPAGDATQYHGMFAAGIPGEVRFVYSYKPAFPWSKQRKMIHGIELDVTYIGRYWNPRTGAEHPVGVITPDTNGSYMLPLEPTLLDWVFIMEKA